eukprot:7772535-Pyramimonas_sp.AAC.1
MPGVGRDVDCAGYSLVASSAPIPLARCRWPASVARPQQEAMAQGAGAGGNAHAHPQWLRLWCLCGLSLCTVQVRADIYSPMNGVFRTLLHAGSSSSPPSSSCSNCFILAYRGS